MTKKIIGIDVGTGGTRAVLVDEKGALLGSATHEHAPFSSPQNGWAEQDPRDWWNACQKAIGKLMQQTGVSKDEIVAVGLAGRLVFVRVAARGLAGRALALAGGAAGDGVAR